MSFKFQWPEFSEEMYAMVRTELTKALNSSERHPSLADDIVASEIHFGHEVRPRLMRESFWVELYIHMALIPAATETRNP
jgi:hypothetical protein